VVPWFAAVSLLAQIPEPIRVTTQLVEIDVVVRDKNGPVAGLAREDFTLRDRGRPQKIAVFRTSSSRVDRASSVPPGPGEFTNRPYGDVQISPHAIVIVWDHLNTEFEDAASGRKQVLQALGQIRTGDRVGLYTLDSDLHIVQDFTSDSALLVEALRKYREVFLPHSLDSIGSRMASTGDPVASAASGDGVPMGAGMSFLAAMENYHAIGNSAAYRAQRTMIALKAIEQHLAGAPGRKSVIWIAGSFPAVAGRLASSGIVVYPVDLTGVLTPASLRRDTRQLPERTLVERTIARQSGGMAFVDNDVRGAIDQAIKDSEVSYTLGFYPDRTPDAMNSLKIEVARKGLDLGYRNAYSGIARPDSKHGTLVGDALASALDATQISLHVHLTRRGEGWSLALDLDPADIALENRNGRRKGGLDIALRQFTVDGLALSTTVTKADLDFDEPQYRAFVSDKHPLSLAIPEPPPGLVSIRLVVADRVSGRVGSLTIPVAR
jgi:VWFA-related protein